MKDIVDPNGHIDTTRLGKAHRRNRFATSPRHAGATPCSQGANPVEWATARFTPCLKAIVCLLSLDSSLRLPRERLRLRLLIGRLVGPVPTSEVGNCLRDLQRMHARGFPVAAMDVEQEFMADSQTASAAIHAFRQDTGHAYDDANVEAAQVARTVEFLVAQDAHDVAGHRKRHDSLENP